MQTRESIVQRLFNEGLITAEEAVVLLKEEVKIIQVPNQSSPWVGPGPGNVPYQPYTPNTPINPINVPYCDWHSGTGSANPVTFTSTSTLNKNYTEK